MLCLEIEQIEQYLSGTLDERSVSLASEHIASCSECRTMVDDVSRNLEVVHQLRGLADDGRRSAASSADVICGYEIVREIGRGASGVVYEAMQREPRRRVALKLLNVGWNRGPSDAHALRSLRREAEALARLRHPGIVSILEAGATTGGRPFMVMELVEGETILQHAKRLSLSVRARIELFRSVCDAVAAAHQRGIIHRDLKPAHIVIAQEAYGPQSDRPGVPRILDFGLAKIIDSADAAAPASLQTEQGRVLGTLPYMSPEQARGDVRDVDVRSDVYALGVVCYELLTAHRPYEVDALRLSESVRAITQQPPARPAVYAHALRGDIETIILKALEKEPARRYDTVAAFSDDLGRWLEDQPILARSATLAYHFRKMIARHTMLFGMAAALLALLIAFAITSTVQALRLNERRVAAIEAQQQELEAKREAQRQADIATAVNVFLTDMLGSANPEAGRGAAANLTVLEALKRAALPVAEAFADQPEIEAAVRLTIGDTYRALGRLSDARAELEQSLAIRRRLHPGDDLDVALTLNKLARCMQDAAEYDAAEAALDEAFGMRKRLLGDEHAEVATILNNLGELALKRGRIDDAERLHRDALALRRASLGDQHVEVATSLNNLAGTLLLKGDLDEAEAMYRASLAMDQALRHADHPNIVATMGNLAVTLGRQNRLPEEEALLREVLERRSQLLGPDHPLVALTLLNLALNRYRQEDLAGAEQLCRASLAIYQAAHETQHPDIARVLHNLGMIVGKTGDTAESERLLRLALDQRERLLGLEHPDTRSSLRGLANLLKQLDRAAEAEALLQRLQ